MSEDQLETIWDLIGAISYTKKNFFDLEEERASALYNPFLVNRNFSYSVDTVFHAQICNEKSALDKKMQHDYLLHAIRPLKRYAKWIKKSDDDVIELIKKVYGYSEDKARQVAYILKEPDIEYLKTLIFEGGAKSK